MKDRKWDIKKVLWEELNVEEKFHFKKWLLDSSFRSHSAKLSAQEVNWIMLAQGFNLYDALVELIENIISIIRLDTNDDLTVGNVTSILFNKKICVQDARLVKELNLYQDLENLIKEKINEQNK